MSTVARPGEEVSSMQSIRVWVVTTPKGKTSVRTTPLAPGFLATAKGKGFTQVPARLNWKAARTITAIYETAG